MSFLDKLKGKSGELKDKASDLAHEHNDKIQGGLDKAAETANKVTKGKYEEKIGGAADKAKGGVERFGDKGEEPNDQPPAS